MNRPYTERQIEVSNILRSVSHEGVSPDQLDEIINMIGDAERESVASQKPKEDTETSIRMRLLDEGDWRKRAALSALLISKSLE